MNSSPLGIMIPPLFRDIVVAQAVRDFRVRSHIRPLSFSFRNSVCGYLTRAVDDSIWSSDYNLAAFGFTFFGYSTEAIGDSILDSYYTLAAMPSSDVAFEDVVEQPAESSPHNCAEERALWAVASAISCTYARVENAQRKLTIASEAVHQCELELANAVRMLQLATVDCTRHIEDRRETRPTEHPR